jgi:hypothetical protein
MPQSQLTKKSRHLGIGVFIVHSSMVLLLYIEQDKPNWQIKNWKGKKVVNTPKRRWGNKKQMG